MIQKPLCPINILEDFYREVLKDEKRNAKIDLSGGILLSIKRLQDEGFLKLSEEELSIVPMPKVEHGRHISN